MMPMQGGANPSARAARVNWHSCRDETEWVAAAVEGIRAALQGELTTHAATWLLLSGGTTPAPVYRALAEQVLDWPRVMVSLVDDRDVDPDADGSNERLVRETLLRAAAAPAGFRPLHTAGQSLADAVRASNAGWPAADATASIALAVLGMGDDGHTASLFPGALNLAAALSATAPYAAIDASGCAVAGAWSQRISLTPHGLSQARQRILLLRGASKRAVFERALAPGALEEMPIRLAIDLPAPLSVYWCP